MLTFVVDWLGESKQPHVVIQSTTDVGQFNYHFGNDVTIEMWENFQQNLEKNHEKKFSLTSVKNQPGYVESTTLDVFVDVIKFKTSSNEASTEEIMTRDIRETLSIFDNLAKQLFILKSQRPLI